MRIHREEREREREAEGEAGPMQGSQRGTRSRVSRIMSWAEGRCETTEPPRDTPLGPDLKQVLHCLRNTRTEWISQ